MSIKEDDREPALKGSMDSSCPESSQFFWHSLSLQGHSRDIHLFLLPFLLVSLVEVEVLPF